MKSCNKQKRRKEEYLEMPEGETEETCKDHAKLMKKEMARTTNKTLAMLKELMGITFSF
jgi:hypothetical protein